MNPAFAPLVASALAMGLFGSTHCILMCGGVVSTLGAGLTQLRAPGTPPPRPIASTLAYNAGRIASYATAGSIAGAFGALVDRIDVLHGAQIGLRVVAGLLMLVVGLSLAGAFHASSALEKLGLPLWRRIEPLAKRLLPVRTIGSALALGALWGWMPCGLVYAALGLALGTGSALVGALTMIAFGLGTLPMLVAMGTLAAQLGRFTRRVAIRRVAGAAIVLFGLFNVAVASAQAGWDHAPHATHSCCAGKKASR